VTQLLHGCHCLDVRAVTWVRQSSCTCTQNERHSASNERLERSRSLWQLMTNEGELGSQFQLWAVCWTVMVVIRPSGAGRRWGFMTCRSSYSGADFVLADRVQWLHERGRGPEDQLTSGAIPGRSQFHASPKRSLSESNRSDTVGEPNCTQSARTTRIYQDRKIGEVDDEWNKWEISRRRSRPYLPLKK